MVNKFVDNTNIGGIIDITRGLSKITVDSRSAGKLAKEW